MPDQADLSPDSTAIRVARWRALHVEVDPTPHLVGLVLAAPKPDCRDRPDVATTEVVASTLRGAPCGRSR